MFFEAEGKGDLKTAEIEVGVGGDGIATAESKINVFVGIYNEVVNCVVAIKVESCQINSTHVIDSSEGILR